MADRLYRALQLDRADAKFDADKRTFEVSFSSETPVDRWGEDEVLSHADGDMDFSRLKAGHPFLLDHNERDADCLVGVVEDAWIDRDAKKGRARIRMGKSERANQIWQDIQEGIRPNISVGYERDSLIRSDKAPNGRKTSFYKWTPYHIASVSVPADPSVGVGRSAETTPPLDSLKTANADQVFAILSSEQKSRLKELFMPETTTATTATDSAAADLQRQREIDAAVAKEQMRRDDIGNWAKQIAAQRQDVHERVFALRDEAISKKLELGEFQVRAMKELFGVPEPKKLTPVTMETMGVSARERQSYSILRATRSIIENDFRSQLPKDGLEREVHDALVKRTRSVFGGDFSPQGLVIPFDAPVRMSARANSMLSQRFGTTAQRDLTVGTFGQGGALVPTETMVPIIEILRNQMSVMKLGVTTMAGLEGNVVIPRQTGAATAYSVPEQGQLTISTQALDQISLRPSRVGAYNQFSRQLLLQSAIDVENFVRDDLLKVMALKWDELVLNGQGSQSEPMGIMNTPGILTNIFGGAPSWSSIVQFETNIAGANAIIGPMGWIVDPATRGVWKTTAKTGVGVTSVVPIFLWETLGEGDGNVNGYRAVTSLQIPNHQVLQGVFDQVIHALWGGYDWIVNPYVGDITGTVRITVNTFGDVALRHPQCFCLSPDSGAV